MRDAALAPGALEYQTLERGLDLANEDAASRDRSPLDELVRTSLERIAATPDFVSSDRSRRFLQFVVRETLAGRRDQLKAYNIALAVFDKDETFDPQTSPLVRVEAGKLRRLLERYYLTTGRDDPVRIDIPKGAYVPTFTPREESARDVATADQSERAGVSDRVSQSGPWQWHGASFRWLLTSLAVLVLLMATATGWLLITNRDGERSTVAENRPTAPDDRPSILIMPFEASAGEDTGSSTLAHGVSREILHKLTQFQELVVIDGGLVMNRHADLDVAALARRLQAGFILRGEVAQRSESIRINAQLSDADGRVIWSRVFEEDLSINELFALQNTISSDVAQTMAQPYGIVFQNVARQLRRTSPGSFSAYQCVLRAYEYRLTMARDKHGEVRDCLEEAVEAAPGYADAVAMLSLLYVDEFRFAYNLRDERPERLTRALEMAQRSIELAPDNATAWRALFYARFVAGETDLALEAGEKALSLNPNNADVKAIVGFRQAVSGHWEEGIATLMDAIAVAPLHPSGYYFALVLDHYRQERHAEALQVMKSIDMADFFWTHAHYAMIYAQLGEPTKARAALARTLELMPDFAERPEDIIRMEIRDEQVIEKMLIGLRKAGLDTDLASSNY